MRWSEYLAQLRTNPKYIADLHAKATSQGELGEIVKFINSPGAADALREYFNFTEYNNEMHGIFIQLAVKEFKQNWGFDEANFPFDDSGGPQRGKLPFGYIYKYWVGKADKSYKMRKFYTEQGYAIIVVFRDPTSPTASPSASAEIKVNQTPPNKKPRVGSKCIVVVTNLYNEKSNQNFSSQITARSKAPIPAAKFHRRTVRPSATATTPITQVRSVPRTTANNRQRYSPTSLLAQITTLTTTTTTALICSRPSI